MSWASIRRLCALALALTLAVGLATHGLQAAHMSGQMAASFTSAPMPDGCAACDEDEAGSPACVSLCAAMAAIMPRSLAAASAAARPVHPPVPLQFSGLRGPPDPFPPKTTI